MLLLLKRLLLYHFHLARYHHAAAGGYAAAAATTYFQRVRYYWVITAAPCRLTALLEQHRGLLRRAALRLLVLCLQREQGPQLPVIGLHAGRSFAPSATLAVHAAVPQRGGA
ncbi:unnamed protein product, partial [Ectocarpus sp. 13 AM-2016]